MTPNELSETKAELEEATIALVDGAISTARWRQHAEATEAKLAVYEAPVADGAVEECAAKLEAYPYEHAPIAVAFLRRLSHDKAEAEAREAKLREALTAAADNHDKLADDAGNRSEYHTAGGHRAAAAALRGVADAFARAALASSSPTKEWAPILTDVERTAITALLNLAGAAWNAADNTETTTDGDEPHHTMFDPWWPKFSDAIEALDELPDDQPGYIMNGPAKAGWALRRLLPASPTKEKGDG